MSEQQYATHILQMDEIFHDSDFNVRGKIAPFDVVSLMQDIERIGLIQPIVVEPYSDPKFKWRIISGHRRHMAFKCLKRTTIPAMIREGLSKIEARVLNLNENLKRSDLNIMQEAHGLADLKNWGLKVADVAYEIGQSRGWVQVRYYALELEPHIQEDIAAGFLNQTQIKDIWALPKAKRNEAVKAIKEARLKGEKVSYKKPMKVNPLVARRREREEIFGMMDHCREVIGVGFYSRFGAWCAGQIPTIALYRDIRELAKQRGIPYEIPSEAVRALNAEPV